MPTAAEHTDHAISAVVQTAPFGTNIALVRLLWVMVSGAFLHSRGAVFAALTDQGFTPQEARRSWAALRSGVWITHRQLPESKGSSRFDLTRRRENAKLKRVPFVLFALFA